MHFRNGIGMALRPEEIGFVFQLSDGGVGVRYQDATNFRVSADGKTLQYSDLDGNNFCSARDPVDGNNNEKLFQPCRLNVV